MNSARDLERPIFRDVFVPLLRRLIQNACVNTGDPDSGHEDDSIVALQQFFDGYGLVGTVVHARPGRGNLIVRVPGRNPNAPSLALMGHVDVVPANAADWSTDPFGAEVRDSHVWGRGTVDMLCWTVAQAVGFAEAVRASPTHNFEGDVVFLALADEEASGRFGAQYLVEHHWDLVKADFMVTELGGFFIGTDAGPAAFCTLGEKGIAWVKLSARGTPGHGSTPYRADNAALKAARAALRLSRHRFPLVASPVYRSMVHTVARGWAERWALLSGWGEGWALGRLFRRNPGMARYLQTAGHTTLSVNLVNAGTKINIIADKAELFLDIRCLPGTTPEALTDELRRALGPLAGDFEITVLDWYPSNISPGQGRLKSALEDLFHQAHPDARLADLVIGGVTDGRYWRPRGTTVYGFTLFSRQMTMDAFAARIHGIDERIDLESLSLGLQFFTDLPERFGR